MAKGRIQPNNKSQDDKFNYRLNNDIRVPRVRLVGDNLEEVSEVAGKTIETGIFNTYQVIQWAEEMEMDLVEISPNADPPVCKIIDYKKFIYDRKKKEKELKAKTAKTVIKEIRFGPNTDDHDFTFKVKHAVKFLEDGEKIKAYVHFRGRAIVFKDRGELILLRFIKELEEYGAAEELPKLEGKRMIVMISPKKKK
ncbi:MAG TPA: translation initiation factor IF-3 [Saprospiraceae bacterium]|nr:translation initiation factor IF-3 [Saprospiraceae bacterium]HRP42908.1 translation initiation factor IF-3 [Saprospiraceae bacterium]